jgi:hypothetical protein
MELINIIRREIDERISGGRRRRKPQEHVMATVSSHSSSGVMVTFDDGGEAVGPYRRLATYSPSEGDRVMLARVGVRNKYVVLGEVE